MVSHLVGQAWGGSEVLSADPSGMEACGLREQSALRLSVASDWLGCCLRWPRESRVHCVLQSPAPGLASTDGSLSSLAGAMSARLLLHGRGLGRRAGCPGEEKMLETSCSSCLLEPTRGSGSFLLLMESGPGPLLPLFLPKESAVLWDTHVGYRDYPRQHPCVRLHLPISYLKPQWRGQMDWIGISSVRAGGDVLGRLRQTESSVTRAPMTFSQPDMHITPTTMGWCAQQRKSWALWFDQHQCVPQGITTGA